MSYNPAGLQTYTLQSSISSTQNTITLSSFLVPVTNTPVTMTLLNTSIAFGTLDPKTNNAEFISFTGITQNSNGTATLTGVVRGLNMTYPFTTNSSFQLSHSGSAQFILSNSPQLYNQYAALSNSNIYTATNNFTGVIQVPTYTSSDTDKAASILYVNNVAIAGAPNASATVIGITKLTTAPVLSTNPLAVGDNDNRVPTIGENNALVGNNTDIAVGSGNTYVTQTGLQHGAEKYVLCASGSSTTYTGTYSPVPTSLTNGMEFLLKIDVANTTTTPTFNPNGLGAKTIVKGTSTALVANDLIVGQVAKFIYDGTNMVLQNPSTLTYYNDGLATRVLNASSGTQTIAHGLGVTPTRVKIRFNGTGYGLFIGEGIWVGGNYACSYNSTPNTYGSLTFIGSSTSAIITFQDYTSYPQTATVTVDATNIYLAWTFTSGYNSNTFNMLWEAWK